MKKKLPLFLIVLLVSLPQLSETIYTPSLPDIGIAFEASDNWMQMTLSIFFFGFSLGMLYWGRHSDVTGRRTAMLQGLLYYFVGCCLCFVSWSIESLMVSRAIQGFGASVGSVVMQTMVRDLYQGKKRHKMFALIGSLIGFAPAIGPLIGGIIDQLFGYHWVFFSLILLGALVLACTYRFLPETLESTHDPRPIKYTLKKMLKDRHIAISALLIGILNGIKFSFFAEAPFIFIEYFGVEPAQYGLIGLFVATTTFLGASISRLSVEKWSPLFPVRCGIYTICIASLVMTVFTYFFSDHSQKSMFIYIFLNMFIYLGIGLTLPNVLSLALKDYQRVLGTSGALFGLGYYVLISSVLTGMSILHDDKLVTMPLYFLVLSVVMLFFIEAFYIRQDAHDDKTPAHTH